MVGFIKKFLFTAMTFFNFNPSNVNSLKCVSMNNQKCKIRPKITNVNNNEPVFYPFSIKVNKCSGSCNNINDPCVFQMLLKHKCQSIQFDVMSNHTKHIKWHETCKCKCRFDSSVCNKKQRWNEDKCRCECRKELSDKER